MPTMRLRSNILSYREGIAQALDLGPGVVGVFNREHARKACRAQVAAGADFGGKISTSGRVTSQYGRRHVFEGRVGISWARGISVQGVDHLLSSDGPMSSRLLVGVLTPPSEYVRGCCQNEGWVDAFSLLSDDQLNAAYDDVMDLVHKGCRYEEAMLPLSARMAKAAEALHPSRLTVIYAPTVEFFRMSGITLGSAVTPLDGVVSSLAHWGTKASYQSISEYVKTSSGTGVYQSTGPFEFLGACYSLLGHCQVKVGSPKLLWDRPDLPDHIGWVEESDLEDTYQAVLRGQLSDSAVTRQARFRGLTSYKGIGYGLDNWAKFASICAANIPEPLESVDIDQALKDVGYGADCFLRAGKAVAIYDILAHHTEDAHSFTLALAVHRKLYDKQARALGTGMDMLYRVKQDSWDTVMNVLLDMVEESGEFMGKLVSREERRILTDMVYLGRRGRRGMDAAVQAELNRIGRSEPPCIMDFKEKIINNSLVERVAEAQETGIEIVEAMRELKPDNYSGPRVKLAELIASESSCFEGDEYMSKRMYQCMWLVLTGRAEDNGWYSLMQHVLESEDRASEVLVHCIGTSIVDMAMAHRMRGPHDLLALLVADLYITAERASRLKVPVEPEYEWTAAAWRVGSRDISETLGLNERPGWVAMERAGWLLDFCDRPSVLATEMATLAREPVGRVGISWACVTRNWLDRGQRSGASRAEIIGLVSSVSRDTTNVIKDALSMHVGKSQSQRMVMIIARSEDIHIVRYNAVLLQCGLQMHQWLTEEAAARGGVTTVGDRLAEWGRWLVPGKM